MTRGEARWDEANLARPDGAAARPVRKWFKLVGVTHGKIPDDWARDEPEIFEKARFPWNKPPLQISRDELLLLYAVEWRRVFATQRVDGPPSINPRRGPKGSVTDRWPHTIAVKTLSYISPVSSARFLTDVDPGFSTRHGRLWQQSHIRLSDDEYSMLARAVEAAAARA